MTLHLFNTYSGKKEPFEPANPNRVTMYVCGPTVYSYAHIGNARPPVVFDVLFRVLREQYGGDAVVYARNFTDIDDKIIRASQESGDPIRVITEKFADIYRDDMAALGTLTPTKEPRATEHIPEMQDLVSALLKHGHAYAEQNHVLFSVRSFDGYGRLSKLPQDDIIAGARVEVAPYKRDPADFVLWKPSADDEPGWGAPEGWGVSGRGRPGWHLECSAMIRAGLGDTIDIHGGGQDLRFPHHENEIAQSCCAHDTGDVPLARYWLHNGFLNMGKDKMSKSLGNIVTPHELLETWQGEVLRFALLSAHYRQPLEWTDTLLEQSKRQLDRFYRVLSDLSDLPDVTVALPGAVLTALQDDLNTPEAISALHALRDRAVSAAGPDQVQANAELLTAGRLMGLFLSEPEIWFKGAGAGGGLADEVIEALLKERTTARQAKNYARADEIRDELAAANIIFEDGAAGTTWRRG
ncbi:cysteine--tRNA ligase [Parvularcula sp. IMCC14364]|uniref:cysteine--tRNA ligase n=1 Tax=Parvularcula sp. IMCC14364 TaxID=3067902 RepID=UPI00274163DB|nr:cysteine--tRNA ligase [Parvularcula sp. IMCC14364]